MAIMDRLIVVEPESPEFGALNGNVMNNPFANLSRNSSKKSTIPFFFEKLEFRMDLLADMPSAPNMDPSECIIQIGESPTIADGGIVNFLPDLNDSPPDFLVVDLPGGFKAMFVTRCPISGESTPPRLELLVRHQNVEDFVAPAQVNALGSYPVRESPPESPDPSALKTQFDQARDAILKQLDPWLATLEGQSFDIDQGRRLAHDIRYFTAQARRELVYDGQAVLLSTAYSKNSQHTTFQLRARGSRSRDSILNSAKMPLLQTRPDE